MRRRDALTLLGSAAVLPLAAHAQQGERVRTIGFLVSTDDSSNLDDRIGAFRQELQRLGWREGSIRLEVRNATANQAHIQALAAELLALPPDVMMTNSNLGTTIAARLTKTIPIVFVAGDPVGSGLVANMARPGGNITGFAGYEASIVGKWLELLREVLPQLSSVTALYTPGGGGSEATRRLFEDTASKLGIRAMSIPASDPATIERAITGATDSGLIVLPGPASSTHQGIIIDAALRHRTPAIYFLKSAVVAGGLMSYSGDNVDLARRAAGYVDRVLRGEKPGDLPVQAPTKFELVVNLKTARAIGLAMPESFLVRADEVIE